MHIAGGQKDHGQICRHNNFEGLLILDRAIEPPREPEAYALDRQMRFLRLTASVILLGETHARRRTGSGHRSSLDKSSEENVVADVHERGEAKMTFEMNFHQIIAILKLCRKPPAR